MPSQKSERQRVLKLEVEEVERNMRPGCTTSSTNPACTCPIQLTASVICTLRGGAG